MTYPAGTELLQTDGSVSLDESGRRLLSDGTSDCDCCPPVDCCFDVAFMFIDYLDGVITTNRLFFARTSFVRPGHYDNYMLQLDDDRWQLSLGDPATSVTWETVSGSPCPPMNYEDYVLTNEPDGHTDSALLQICCRDDNMNTDEFTCIDMDNVISLEGLWDNIQIPGAIDGGDPNWDQTLTDTPVPPEIDCEWVAAGHMDGSDFVLDNVRIRQTDATYVSATIQLNRYFDVSIGEWWEIVISFETTGFCVLTYQKQCGNDPFGQYGIFNVNSDPGVIFPLRITVVAI